MWASYKFPDHFLLTVADSVDKGFCVEEQPAKYLQQNFPIKKCIQRNFILPVKRQEKTLS